MESAASVVLAVSLPLFLLSAGIAAGGDVGLFQRAPFGVLNLWILVWAISA